MIKVFTLSLALASAAAALGAQDTIHWTDGTKSERITVQSFNILEIAYQEGGARQSRSSDQVGEIVLGDQKDTYRRGYANKDAGLFLNTARELIKSNKARDKVMAQVGYLEASKLSYGYGEDALAVQTLAELISEMPDTGFAPHWHRTKLDVYLGNGDAAQAKAAATKYYNQATTSGWPSGFAHDAEFYQIIAAKVAGEADPAALQQRLKGLTSKLAPSERALNNRCNVELANAMREGDDIDGARRIYESLIEQEAVDDSTLAGGYLGLGHIAMKAAADSRDKEGFYKAMLYFLRVYVETKEAWGSQRAEALHFGSQCARQWGGERSNYMASKLAWLLEQNYPGSEWVNK